MEERDVRTSPTEYATKLLAQAAVPYEKGQANTSSTNNYFKSATWSPDGTCVITNSADNHIRTFVVPPDLLEDRDHALQLKPYSSVSSFEAVNALACYPCFDLQDASTALILSVATEHPIRLNSALEGRLLASYPLISSTTEAYIKPQSLLFESDGSHFITGSHSLISFFDVSRTGEPPSLSVKTGPKNSRSRWHNPGTALTGLISALAIDPQYHVLAAGTLNRQIGFYDAGGRGECVGVFSTAGSEADPIIMGQGVTQVLWSRCGRYLYIAERKSDGCLIYDIRKTGQLLSWTVGRNALTNQRIAIDLHNDSSTGSENLWAGGTDGAIRLWKKPSLQAGAVEASVEFQAHSDVANSVSVHPEASVVASAAGQRDLVGLRTPETADTSFSSQSRDLLALHKVHM